MDDDEYYMETYWMPNKQSSDKFCMVVSDGNDPKVRHKMKSGAEKQATRLSERNPDKTFYVLEAVESYVLPTHKVVKNSL
jgi:hypothetical protein